MCRKKSSTDLSGINSRVYPWFEGKSEIPDIPELLKLIGEPQLGFPCQFQQEKSQWFQHKKLILTERWHQPKLQELLLGNLNITIGNHHFPWENSLNVAIFPMEMMKMPRLELPGGIDPSYSPRTPAEVIDLFTQVWIEKDLYFFGDARIEIPIHIRIPDLTISYPLGSM